MLKVELLYARGFELLHRPAATFAGWRTRDAGGMLVMLAESNLVDSDVRN
jgi:hypothetical protein